MLVSNSAAPIDLRSVIGTSSAGQRVAQTVSNQIKIREINDLLAIASHGVDSFAVHVLGAVAVKPHQALILAAAVAAMTLLAPGPGASAQQDTFRVVMHADLRSIDPVASSAYIVRNHGYMVYDTLFAMDEGFKVRPQMVETWHTSDDNRVTTITLRPGLEWHDGSEVTSQDCIASLKRWSSRDPIGQKLARSLDEYRAINDRTFQIVLKEPFGSVLEALAKPSGTVPFMMPKRLAETDPYKAITDPTGSGPFIFDRSEWRPGDKAVYRKNPRYKPRSEPPSGLAGGKVVSFDRVEWLSIPNPQTQVQALLAGEIDMVESVPYDLLPLLQQSAEVKLIEPQVTLQYILRMNWLQPPFNNRLVRKAAFLALKQQDYLQIAIGNPKYWRECKAIFTCGTPFASEAGMRDRLNGDAGGAAALLKEAAYDGTPVVILQPADVSLLRPLAPVVKMQLERAGFKVDVVTMDWQSLLGRLTNKGLPSQGGWNLFTTALLQFDVFNPLTASYLVASCDTASVGWPCASEMEDLRDRYARAAGFGEKQRLADEIQVLNAELVAEVPLGEFFPVAAVRSRSSRTFEHPAIAVFWGMQKN